MELPPLISRSWFLWVPCLWAIEFALLKEWVPEINQPAPGECVLLVVRVLKTKPWFGVFDKA